MSLTADRFDEFFRAIYDYAPFPWQSRLANDLAANKWPDCIDLPTASGKTSVIDIAVFTLACQATTAPKNRMIGRRIFFTVNRRVIVDEAYERAVDLAKAIRDAKTGILKEVADALRSIGGDERLPLDVVQLRGGIYRDSSWARSVVQPMVICTTVDQLGSRLLFRGYGVSAGMLPIHAALTACDSVILLDEAHVTKPFAQTLRLAQGYQQHRPGIRFVEMTATPSAQSSNRFELAPQDRAHPVLKKRQEAAKPAELVKVAQKSLVTELVKRSTGAVNDQRKAIGIIVNRVQTARDVYAKLAEQFPGDVHLVIGRMRPIDRDILQGQLRSLVGPGRPDILEKPVFIVATQCLEIGADYDFDALITECASIDALRQRFGRLNRKGRDIVSYAAIITTDATLKEDDPVYVAALKETWNWLTSDGRVSVDFGIAAFKQLWDALDDGQKVRMTNLTQDAAVLLPAHLDALCQTNPQPAPSPDVSYFIHGPQRDNLEVNVCWRADLGPNDETAKDRWPEIVSMLPPSSPECMTVPLRAVREWMRSADQPVDADVPVRELEEERKTILFAHIVLRWRGLNDAKVVSNPNELRPGDIVVISASDESSRILGHIPERDGVVVYDLAEQAIAIARRQRIIRVHPAVHPELVESFKDYLAETIRLTKTAIRSLLMPRSADFSAGPHELDYPDVDNSPMSGVIFRFNGLLPKADDWKADESIEDDGDDASSESTHPLVLSKHVDDVLHYTLANLTTLGLTALTPIFETAAARHDDGKSDLRFTAMLAGTSPYYSVGRPPLAKSGERGLSRAERAERRARALLPERFRHESLSMQIVEHFHDQLVKDNSIDRALLLHLIMAHHGYGRPFAPVVIDTLDDAQLLEVTLGNFTIDPATRQSWTPSHRLDSGVAERFWDLTRKYGWWGLAYLEAILRLADQQASAMEQEGKDK